MNHRNHFPLALTLLAVALTATRTGAQSTYTPYTFTTLAGVAGRRGNGDGTNSAASFYGPYCVAVNSAGTVYVADTGNSTIRKVTPLGTNWVVTTLAGLAGSPGSADGTGAPRGFMVLPAWRWTARATSMWRTQATTRSGK